MDNSTPQEIQDLILRQNAIDPDSDTYSSEIASIKDTVFPTVNISHFLSTLLEIELRGEHPASIYKKEAYLSAINKLEALPATVSYNTLVEQKVAGKSILSKILHYLSEYQSRLNTYIENTTMIQSVDETDEETDEESDEESDGDYDEESGEESDEEPDDGDYDEESGESGEESGESGTPSSKFIEKNIRDATKSIQTLNTIENSILSLDIRDAGVLNLITSVSVLKKKYWKTLGGSCLFNDVN